MLQETSNSDSILTA